MDAHQMIFTFAIDKRRKAELPNNSAQFSLKGVKAAAHMML
jgi:hypothetical protein